ncbi:MAG: hypothetical protein ACE5FU_08700, partial [Nitrospinota bacterium]
GDEGKSYVRQYDFSISNIDVLQTSARTLEGGEELPEGENIIRFYIAQVPEDTPNTAPVFRMKEVRVNFSTVSQDSKVILTPGDFLLLE